MSGGVAFSIPSTRQIDEHLPLNVSVTRHPREPEWTNDVCSLLDRVSPSASPRDSVLLIFSLLFIPPLPPSPSPSDPSL